MDIFLILYGLVGLMIFYIVIETAVRNGINNSVIGRGLQKKHGNGKGKTKSFFDNDLDDER